MSELAIADRCPDRAFQRWLLPWLVVLAVGIWACTRILSEGLYLTNMDNRFAFGLWIFLDLTVIAFGAGAFMSGILVYVLRWENARPVLNLSVILGFLCYSGAVAILLVDVGQPLRAWFTLWHPNVHSMLAEVTFCLSCYLVVLAVEAIPVLLRHRRLRRTNFLAAWGGELHRWMVVLALLGATLSFFHQGSLGGLYGVLQGRPFAYREGVMIWPTTFFLFVASAMAIGPSFLLLVARAFEGATRRRLVPDRCFTRLARLSGNLLLFYLFLKSVDTLIWFNRTLPESGIHPAWLYRQPPFGSWVLVAELLLLGLIPAFLLRRSSRRSQLWGAVLACAGIMLNRLLATLQTLTLPTLPFERTWSYVPNFWELAAFAAVIAYAVIVLSLAYRWLPLFPSERGLDAPSRR
jgi:molybdopterin-containing oxidoreductase family membrane subunit